MTDTQPLSSTSHSLESIRDRKAILLKDIRKDSQMIELQWNSLFHRPEMLKKDASPSKRVNSFINAGAGVLDAALLVWKLYRKFKK